MAATEMLKDTLSSDELKQRKARAERQLGRLRDERAAAVATGKSYDSAPIVALEQELAGIASALPLASRVDQARYAVQREKSRRKKLGAIAAAEQGFLETIGRAERGMRQGATAIMEAQAALATLRALTGELVDSLPADERGTPRELLVDNGPIGAMQSIDRLSHLISGLLAPTGAALVAYPQHPSHADWAAAEKAAVDGIVCHLRRRVEEAAAF